MLALVAKTVSHLGYFLSSYFSLVRPKDFYPSQSRYGCPLDKSAREGRRLKAWCWRHRVSPIDHGLFMLWQP